MNTDPANIAAKIQKLLALADSSNEHEAASAAGHASALLAKYNLSLADLPGDASTIHTGHDLAFTKCSSPWVRRVWQAVARLNFCGYAFSGHCPSELDPSSHPRQPLRVARYSTNLWLWILFVCFLLSPIQNHEYTLEVSTACTKLAHIL